MSIRRFMLASLVLACGMNACVSNPEQWEARQHARELPAVFVTASRSEIQARCPKTPNAIGCAVRDFTGNVCRVYVPADAPIWLLGHELLHCAGWNHA